VKPALSVIFFSTVSGTGYGMLAWFGVASWLGLVPPDPASSAASIALALALATAGLLASTLHLGRPERAWRAISQWRTSWLSREGLASLITYVPAGVLLIAWIAGAGAGPFGTWLALLAAAMAVVTVICTGMIYASLKPVRQWHNRFVLPLYVLLSLYSGATWLAALISFWQPGGARLVAIVAVVVGVVAIVLKVGYWRFIDRGASQSTPESATGLGAFGKVRLLDPPHTQENYLTREMGFAIARKHARQLRSLTLVIGFAIPAVLMVLSWLLGPEGTGVALSLAAVLVLAGLFVERWLFFAEATHTVVLYYGRTA
jgi:sulfite dehydrogenase (quinone) subunit SoeC